MHIFWRIFKNVKILLPQKCTLYQCVVVLPNLNILMTLRFCNHIELPPPEKVPRNKCTESLVKVFAIIKEQKHLLPSFPSDCGRRHLLLYIGLLQLDKITERKHRFVPDI